MNLPTSDPIIFSDSYCIEEEAYRTYHFFFLLCCIWSQRQNCVTLGKLHNLSEPYLSNDANDTYPRGFIHSFSKYLSKTYCGSATVLSIRDTVMSRTDKAHDLRLMTTY